jgi:hypothetical protein
MPGAAHDQLILFQRRCSVASRVSMRSVHTECSTHHQRLRMSAACGGGVSPATVAARLVSSLFMGPTPPLFLRPLTPRALPRFSATMDALTPVGRLFGPLGHEHRSVPQRVSLLLSSTRPTVLSPTTRPSPSRHFSSSTLFLWSESQADPSTLWPWRHRGALPTWVQVRASHSTLLCVRLRRRTSAAAPCRFGIGAEPPER